MTHTVLYDSRTVSNLYSKDLYRLQLVPSGIESIIQGMPYFNRLRLLQGQDTYT